MRVRYLRLSVLKTTKACEEAREWAKAFYAGRTKATVRAVIADLVRENHQDWALWILPRLMTHRQTVRYAVFCARQSLSVYEARFPNDRRPRQAIDAAEAFVRHPSAKNRAAARAAARAARAAAGDAWAAGDAARAAAGAAWAAGDAARAAAWAAEDAARAAAGAAWAAWAAGAAGAAWAAWAAGDAGAELRTAQISEGLRILGA
jgi:hypothetical protein